MEHFEIVPSKVEEFPLFTIRGYFNAETGKRLAAAADPLLEAGQVHLLLDLTDCSVLNSPGIGELLELAFRVSDDFKGKLILFGADQLKLSVLNLTGMLEVAGTALDLADAVRKAREAKNPLPQ